MIKKIIGYSILTVVYLIVFIAHTIIMGFTTTLFIFLISIAATVLIIIAVNLIT